MLRQHVRESTHVGIEAKKHMDTSDLVPNEVMIQLVLNDVEGWPPRCATPSMIVMEMAV